MKIIELKEGLQILTPWLRSREAAAYCGISITSFERHAKELEHGTVGFTKVYHIDVLDTFCEKIRTPEEFGGKNDEEG